MLLLALMAALTAAPAAPNTNACAYDKAAMLALPYDRFDQDPKGGWRAIETKPECFGPAADLIAAYRKAHWTDLTQADLHTLYWHEGQGRAMAGDYRLAVQLILAGNNPNGLGGNDEYTLGTAAFLKRDLPALKSARDRLAAIPEPPGWAKDQEGFKAKFGWAPTWPPNLDVLDGLILCFDRPYKDAYGCRPKKLVN